MNVNTKTKTCTGCKEELPANTVFFARDKRLKSGLKSRCKSCNKVYRKKHYNKNRDEIRRKQNDYLKVYYEKNKEDVLDYKRTYYQENKVDILDYGKKYREKNTKKTSERRRRYRINNRDKIRVAKQRRRSQKANLPSTLTKCQWKKTLSSFSGGCAYCGKRVEMQQEHFIPLSKGGEYSHDNIIPSCGPCNNSKYDKDFFDWYPGFEYYSREREEKILSHLGYNNKKQQLSIL